MALSILFGLWRCLVLWIKYKEIKAGFGGVVDMENFDKELLIPPAFTITSTVGSMAAFLVAPLGFIAWGVRALFF
ncbi:uncharacterized protein METZ01_LOCUS364037 [marine metagenome]|uniref:Uncharacterized protein n=1 Tax=marine metagenome TaxID=408172 RepID=A0A382SMY9_9ZZZZ